MTVTFCGHRYVGDDGVRAWLEECVEGLIAEGADRFYLGGYGEFDRMAASVVWKIKETYPHIESVLVLAYLDRKVNAGLYDRTMYPPLERVPKCFAISRRNEYMVELSDVVVAYVLMDGGGAAATCRYAARRGKRIVILIFN